MVFVDPLQMSAFDVSKPSWMTIQTDDVIVARQVEMITRENPVVPVPMFGKYFIIQSWEGNSAHFNIRLNEIRGAIMTDDDRWWKKREVVIQRIPNSDDINMICDSTFYRCIPMVSK